MKPRLTDRSPERALWFARRNHDLDELGGRVYMALRNENENETDTRVWHITGRADAAQARR